MFVTSESSKCFGYDKKDHVIKHCPNKVSEGGEMTGGQTQIEADPTAEPQNQDQRRESNEPQINAEELRLESANKSKNSSKKTVQQEEVTNDVDVNENEGEELMK